MTMPHEPAAKTRWLLTADEREVAITLLRRATIWLPNGSAAAADVRLFLQRLDEGEADPPKEEMGG